MFKVAYDPIYVHPLEEGHRFPMIKYELLPQQLILEGICTSQDFFAPDTLERAQVLGVHTADYLDRLVGLRLTDREIRKNGFPLSQRLVDRELIIADGTVKASISALQDKISFNIAGGTHHAYADHGEAFCLLNDQAIAAQYLIDNQFAHKVLIVDLDVHQGNGTAKIFTDYDAVYTFSMHGKNNYPFKKEKSDLDIALEDNTDDDKYLSILHKILPSLITTEQPDFIFYLCGVDVLSTDKLGKLGLSVEGCMERDRFVLQMCEMHNIPVMCSMGGGYSPDVKTVVEAHANTFRVAREIFY